MPRRPFWSLVSVLLLASWGGLAWDKAIPPERAIATLETALQHLADEDRRQPGTAAHLTASLGLAMTDGLVTVVVEADALEGGAVATLGGIVVHAAPELGVWEVRVPPGRLADLAHLPGVRYVRRPHRPVPHTPTQGVALTGAGTFHAAGHRGGGVRVAVIDLEFGGLARAVAQGRLTRVVMARDYTGSGLETGGPHGVACAEIVQDMAPEAELILMKIDNEVQFARAVADAVGLGVRVIAHSVGWFNTNFYDGTGIVCDIIRSATDRGVLWVSSAGNSADGAHWEGEWTDRDRDGLLDFAPGVSVNTFAAEAGAPIGIWLTWDGWPTTDQDYDLYLVQIPSGLVVESSTNTQTGGQPPTEQVFFVPPFSGTYGIVIRAYNAPQAPRLELFTTSRVKLRYPVATSSIPAPGNAPFVLTVGAIAAASWTTGPQETYSSQGPTNRSRLNPTSLVKPDLMGPDRVDTLSYGPGAFPGTSASAPHVAGAAAVVWSANPSWSMPQVRAWLEGSAVDMGSAGKDNVYGHGRLNLPAPGVPPPSGTSHTYGTAAGWYLVSVPTVGDAPAIFGVTLYRWNGTAYETVTTLEPHQGYWARLPANTRVTASGTVPTADQTLVLSTAGWHQVSAPWSYPKSAIRVLRGGETKTWAEAVAAGWVRDAIYGYKATDGVYTTPTTLVPWYGYWVNAKVSGLGLRFAYASRAMGAGVSSDGPALAVWGEFPPPPPGGTGVTGEIRFVNRPNPITDVRTTTFDVLGPMAALVTEIRVRVFDLSGKLVWAGSAAGDELNWHTDDLSGRHLANGVYLYQVQALVDGTWVVSELKKLAIYR